MKLKSSDHLLNGHARVRLEDTATSRRVTSASLMVSENNNKKHNVSRGCPNKKNTISSDMRSEKNMQLQATDGDTDPAESQFKITERVDGRGVWAS